METISTLEQMDEYIRKSKEKGEVLFEFQESERLGIVAVKIRVPECDENGYRIIKIPSFVDFIISDAWQGLKNPDKFVYYIPKGCSLDFPAIYDVNGTYVNDQPCYLAKKSYKLEVEEGHENYVSENGVLFNRDKTVLLVYPSFKTEEEYSVPDSVVQILEGAFSENRYLKKLFISKNIVEIQPCQFVYSTSIEVDSENTVYKSDKGFLYSKDGKTCYHVFMEEFDEIEEFDEFIFSEEPEECIATEKVADTDIANGKNIKEMKKYLCKAKMLGLDLFEFQYEEEIDYVWISKIKGPMGHTQGHPIVDIPSFVSLMSEFAFSENNYSIKENIKDAILYVSKECKIGSDRLKKSSIAWNFGHWLYKIVVDESNEYYSSEEGVLFDKDKTEILAYPAYKTEEEYVIPDSVGKISGSIFSMNHYLKKIIISKNVIDIDKCKDLINRFVEVDSQNTRYKSIQGSLYSKDGKIAYYLYDHGNGRFRIEEGTVILKKVDLPAYVEELYFPTTLEPIDGLEYVLNDSYIKHMKIKAPKRLEKYLVVDEDRIEVEYYD